MSTLPAVAVPELPDPLLAEAYEKAATRSVLPAVNNDVFFGYFSVCADGKGHGGDSTYPGLDWGQSSEALLWLGREDLIRASWDYVKSFQRTDGALPFAIAPSMAGTTQDTMGYKLVIEPGGGIFRHWFPGDPLRTLAPVTFIMTADAIFRQTLDADWLRRQADSLRLTVGWLERMIDAGGRVGGAGFYLERPTRVEYDGVNQCYSAHAFRLAAGLFDVLDDTANAARCRALAERITATFRNQFWDGDQFLEYIHPERGRIKGHGLTDVDWIAVATGAASDEQVRVLWPRLREASDFVYSGVPTGIATRPETYEDWEVHFVDRHDISAMGRVWYLEAWARAEMGDGEGLVASLKKVAEAGRGNDWYWMERYYSERTGDLASYRYNTYVEYPACLIRIVNKFLLGIDHKLDGSLRLAPVVPASFWEAGFGHQLAWAGRTLSYRFHGGSLTGSYTGPENLRLSIRFQHTGTTGAGKFQVNGKPAEFVIRNGLVELELPASAQSCSFELLGSVAD